MTGPNWVPKRSPATHRHAAIGVAVSAGRTASMIEAVARCASELVTNALVYGGGLVRFVAVYHPPTVRIEVYDRDRSHPPIPSPDRTNLAATASLSSPSTDPLGLEP